MHVAAVDVSHGRQPANNEATAPPRALRHPAGLSPSTKQGHERAGIEAAVPRPAGGRRRGPGAAGPGGGLSAPAPAGPCFACPSLACNRALLAARLVALDLPLPAVQLPW